MRGTRGIYIFRKIDVRYFILHLLGRVSTQQLFDVSMSSSFLFCSFLFFVLQAQKCRIASSKRVEEFTISLLIPIVYRFRACL